MYKMRRIIEQLHHRPWFATIGVYESVRTLVQSKLEGRSPAKADGMEDFFVQRAPMRAEPSDIAVIDVSGVLGRRLSNIEKSCGACDYGDILADISSAKRMGATGYLFHIDSGGGMATGCAEVASAIAALEAPTVAFVDGMGCSAAYFIASACDLLVASQSASVGSIGVILPWLDTSKMMDLMGLKLDPFTNEGADLKGMSPAVALTDEQRTYLQGEVNDMGQLFKEFVLSNRPGINEEVFRAGTYFGKHALDLGLIDSIGSMAEVQGLLKAKVDTFQKAKLMPENTNQVAADSGAHAHTIVDPGHQHASGSVSNVTTTSGTALPVIGQITYPEYVSRNDMAAQLASFDGLFAKLEAKVSTLETRCQTLESNLRTTQAALAGIPSADQVQEAVDKRFAVHEAARGHGSPIKQPVDAELDPREAARARTRTNPHVLKVLEQIGARG